MLKFKNEDKRLKDEFEQLKSKNKLFYNLMRDLSIFVEVVIKKDVIVTMIYRTDQEQDEIYKDDPKYKIKKFKSPHQFWHGIDIRSLSFNDKEIEQIENYLNSKYNKTNFYAWTAKNHKVGEGAYHFHLQYIKR